MPRFVFRKATWRGMLLGVICALVCWGLTRLPLLQGLEGWLLDSCFAARGERETSAKIVIIGLDDESLDGLGKPLMFASPELATAVRYAHEQGAAATGVDIILPESAAKLDDIVEPGGEGDASLMGMAVLEAGNVTLAEWHLPSGVRSPFPQWMLKAFTMPEPADVGFVDLFPDNDQFVRRHQLLKVLQPDTSPEEPIVLPAFSLALVARAGGGFTWDDREGLSLSGDPVPLGDDQYTLINFVGPPGSFPVIPLSEIRARAASGRASPELKDAIVIIGVTADDWQDYHATPYSNLYTGGEAGSHGGLMSGPEIQANVAATLLDRAFIRRAPWLQPILLIVFGLMLGLAAMRYHMAALAMLTLGYALALYLAKLAAFKWFDLHLEIVGLLFLGGVCMVAGLIRRGMLLQKILRAVKSAPIAKALEADPGQLDLGGERREVSILFADVRGFTAFSEQFSDEPHRVVALLNAYFTAIVPEIEKHGGTLNQYMGDGIMVIFGAPEPQLDHAVRSVRAARAMVMKVHELAEEWARLGKSGMRIGVGINTGFAVVGAIGSPRRLDYSAIGDTTNVAARVEAKTKDFRAEILISEATLRKLTEKEAEEFGLLNVKPFEAELKGKTDTFRLYPASWAGKAPESASEK